MVIIGQVSHYLETLKRQVSNIINDLFFFWFFRVYSLIFLLLNTSIWSAAIYIKKMIGEPRIALHYNVDFGIDYYGNVDKIFVLPLLGLLIYIVNTILLALVRNRKDRKFIGHILGIFSVFSNLILLVAIASVYLINFR